jgi:hypothetical protein
MKRANVAHEMETEKRPNNDSPCIHINSIPYEILGIMLNECEEFSFIGQFVCKHWKGTYDYLIKPEWNRAIQKEEKRKERVTMRSEISFSFLKWAVDCAKDRKKVTHISSSRAALAGDLDSMKYLDKQGCPINSDIVKHSIKGGNIEVVKWLRKQGHEFNKRVFGTAVKRGDLDICIYLKEQRCPWGKRTFAKAARYGHLKVMKWLKEQGCPRYGVNAFI